MASGCKPDGKPTGVQISHPPPNTMRIYPLILALPLTACAHVNANMTEVCERVHMLGVAVDAALPEESEYRDQIKRHYDPVHSLCFAKE